MPSKATAAFVLNDESVAIIESFAKDQGDSSKSAALRRIISEWASMRRANHTLAQDADCDEAARATAGDARAVALREQDAARRAWERTGDPDGPPQVAYYDGTGR